MDINWCLDWYDYMIVIRDLNNMYLTIIEPDWFNEDSPPERALLWLARNSFLNIQVDLIRDLFWQNLEGRYPNGVNIAEAQEAVHVG